jgi:hypothetical protein
MCLFTIVANAPTSPARTRVTSSSSPEGEDEDSGKSGKGSDGDIEMNRLPRRGNRYDTHPIHSVAAGYILKRYEVLKKSRVPVEIYFVIGSTGAWKRRCSSLNPRYAKVAGAISYVSRMLV